ncbi:alpha/beta fold hydrolase [Sandaracinus amylolyticus]|uniref:Putative 2-succinyl-6-hydroxy-2,4-cyclohexadiene-1-carboxylate synthase n=1 Tax=Sandaracinus amylolyticus TaxID=927083 RepID=A0A0F6SI22_9BACT|nr:alpha/beta fold hydrolase [Sandaracinus amylolyticus]AKF11439.1 2-succinyl-6-hydroxy-2,4-cyclohexadiene-1-carboxylate synthase [Sandaracinus amylolyticus]
MTTPFVFLHGFTGSPASWAPVLAHVPDADALALLGHAGSTSTARTWDEEIERLAASITGRVHLVGYSLGGRIALAVALRRPEVIAQLTLIGASPGIEDDVERAARREADEARARMLEREGLDAFVDAWEREPIFATQQTLSPEVRAAHRRIRLAQRAGGLATSLRVLGQGAMPSLWPELATLDVPTRLVVGSEDAKLRAIATRMLERLPRATLHVVGGAGHDVGLERPDALAAILLQESLLQEDTA